MACRPSARRVMCWIGSIFPCGFSMLPRQSRGGGKFPADERQAGIALANAIERIRWSPRGAHLMLKVRIAVTNRILEHDHAAAERSARRPFRRVA